MMRGCLWAALMATAVAVRDSLSLDQLSITSSGPAEDLEEWIDAKGLVTADDSCDDEAPAAAKTSLAQHTNLNSTGRSSSLAEQNSYKTMDSQITLHWMGPAGSTDYRPRFMSCWSSIPVGPSDEFKISGTLYDISKDLNERADLTTSSPPAYEGQAINLCIGKAMPKAADAYKKAFAGAFSEISGFTTLIAHATDIFGAGGTVLHDLAGDLEAAVNAIVSDSSNSKVRQLLSKITGDKTVAWFTVSSMCKNGAAIKVPFKVQAVGGRHSACWDTGRAVTAKEVAALIVMSR